MIRHWDKKEVAFLKKNYSSMLDKDLARQLGRTTHAVKYIAWKLRLKKEYSFYCSSRKKLGLEISKELLNRLYFDENKSMRKIAKELKVGKTTVEHYFRKYGIQRRSKHDSAKIRFKTDVVWKKGRTKENDPYVAQIALKVSQTRAKQREEKLKNIEKKYNKSFHDLLHDLYWNRNFTQEKIAKELDMDRKYVIDLMRKYDISKRCNYEVITKVYRGKNHPMYGKTWEKLYGKEEADRRKKDTSRRFRRLIIKRLENKEMPFTNTKIERLMEGELQRRKIVFKSQYPVAKKFVCDFALPEYNIIVECDGDYWHANPAIYRQEKLHPVQKRRVQTDRFKDGFLPKQGWTVLRFYESDIIKDVKRCVDVVEQEMKSKKEQIKAIQSPLDRL